jgi:hypothetical protein
MATEFDNADVVGVYIQNVAFLLALILLLAVEFHEHRRAKDRRENITNFTETGRVSQTEDDFLVSIRENIIRRTEV